MARPKATPARRKRGAALGAAMAAQDEIELIPPGKWMYEPKVDPSLWVIADESGYRRAAATEADARKIADELRAELRRKNAR